MATDDLQTKAAEMMKKVLTVGVGALFLTEDALRTLVTEFKLPKELLGGILDSANKTKNEFLQSLSRDVLSRVTDKVDPASLLQEFFTSNDIDLHVKISFKKKKHAQGEKSVHDAASEK